MWFIHHFSYFQVYALMKEQLGVERSLDDLHPEVEVSEDDDKDDNDGKDNKAQDKKSPDTLKKDDQAKDMEQSLGSARGDKTQGKKPSGDSSKDAKGGNESSDQDEGHDEL
jgi:hypothetical protein